MEKYFNFQTGVDITLVKSFQNFLRQKIAAGGNAKRNFALYSRNKDGFWTRKAFPNFGEISSPAKTEYWTKPGDKFNQILSETRGWKKARL